MGGGGGGGRGERETGKEGRRGEGGGGPPFPEGRERKGRRRGEEEGRETGLFLLNLVFLVFDELRKQYRCASRWRWMDEVHWI